MCEATDAELLLGYLKWIRLDSAGSIPAEELERFNSQFVDTKERSSPYLLSRLTNGRGKLLSEVQVKTPGHFPWVWIGVLLNPMQNLKSLRRNLEIKSLRHKLLDTFPEFVKDSENRAEAYASLTCENLSRLLYYIRHVKWNYWRKRNVTESFELHAGLKRRSSLEGRKWVDHKYVYASIFGKKPCCHFIKGNKPLWKHKW